MDEQEESSNLGLLGGITGLVALFMVMSLLCIIVSGVVLYSMANVPAEAHDTTEVIEEQPAVEGETTGEETTDEATTEEGDNAGENSGEETDSHDSSRLPALILTI